MFGKQERRVAVVTGASSGIGKEAAKTLVSQGWQVIGLGRDPGRSAAAEPEIRAAAAGDAQFDMIVADLSLLAETARAAREIAARTDRVDILLNNAGGVAKEQVITAEGNEGTFAGNHLGPFLLTDRLLPLLRAAAAQSAAGHTRIVNVSSLAIKSAPGFNWDDPQMIENFGTGPAYCNAKLANMLFTLSLSKKLAADNIVVNAMHPGVVDSNFTSHGDDMLQSHMNSIRDRFVTSGHAAKTLIWLATAPEAGATSGGYYYECAPAPATAKAHDEAEADRLWALSEQLVARAGV